MVLKKAALGLLVATLCGGCCPMICGRGAGTTPHLGEVRHVVLFKFKDDATRQQIEEIEGAFRALPSKIPQVRDFEWGTDVSTEGLAQGYTHCFLVTFEDAEARDAYLPHPAHKAFVEQLQPVLDKVLVIDYVARQ
ncbi:MAG: Dabb family protein [Candidatus Brocadiia bacterium]